MRRTLLLLWFVAILSGATLDFWHEEQFLPPPEKRNADDVLIDAVGEIKTVLARYLWFRMDIYHEVLDSQGVNHEKQTQLVPLMRMVTLLDPSMTDSYDQIAWDLYRGEGDTDTALAVLNEGIQRNPDNYELRFRRALIDFLRKDYKKSQKDAIETLPYTDDPVQMADCLRLIYWSADKLDDKETRRHALSDLRKLRPNDPVWIREEKRLRPVDM